MMYTVLIQGFRLLCLIWGTGCQENFKVQPCTYTVHVYIWLVCWRAGFIITRKLKLDTNNDSLSTVYYQGNKAVSLLLNMLPYPVSPDAIHEHVKTKREEVSMRLHYTAPEYADGPVGTAADIYAFGMCALEVSSP